MKKSNLFLLAVLLCGTLFLACKKDSATGGTNTNTCRITRDDDADFTTGQVISTFGTIYRYDSQKRLISSQGATSSGPEVTYTYIGNRIFIDDKVLGNGHVDTAVVDANNNILEFRGYDGFRLDKYSYDSNGRMTKKTDQFKNYDIVTYDASNNLIKVEGFDESNVSQGTVTYEYAADNGLFASSNSDLDVAPYKTGKVNNKVPSGSSISNFGTATITTISKNSNNYVTDYKVAVTAAGTGTVTQSRSKLTYECN